MLPQLEFYIGLTRYCDIFLESPINKKNVFLLINKSGAQAAGQTLPDATPPLVEISLFTKIAVTFDPIKRFGCP